MSFTWCPFLVRKPSAGKRRRSLVYRPRFDGLEARPAQLRRAGQRPGRWRRRHRV